MADHRCLRCGATRNDHWGLNWSDGQMSSGTVLICPTAVYLEADDTDQPIVTSLPPRPVPPPRPRGAH